MASTFTRAISRAVGSTATAVYSAAGGTQNIAIGFTAANTSGTAPVVIDAYLNSQAFVCTGSITTNVLTVTAIASGIITPNSVIAGTGVTPGTTVLSQIAGNAGGTGTYTINTSISVASTTITSVGFNTYIIRQATIPLGGSLALFGYEGKLIINAGDVFYVLGNTSPAVDATLSLLIIT